MLGAQQREQMIRNFHSIKSLAKNEEEEEKSEKSKKNYSKQKSRFLSYLEGHALGVGVLALAVEALVQLGVKQSLSTGYSGADQHVHALVSVVDLVLVQPVKHSLLFGHGRRNQSAQLSGGQILTVVRRAKVGHLVEPRNGKKG
jgi:hypothetical protein